MWEETVYTEAPYDFDKVLNRLSLDPLQAIDMPGRTLKVPLYLEGTPQVITVSATGTTEHPSFVVAGQNKAHKDKALERLRTIFHWHLPIRKIHEHFEQTVLQPVFDIHRGTALLLDFDLFGNLTKSIIHQQLNLKFAFVLTARFVRTFGMELDGAWFYPRPETVAGLTVEQLRELQFSGRKAEYLIGLAAEITEGRLDLEGLREKTDEEVIVELTKIRGIGKWTAESFLLFGLGRPNVFPKADIGIQNAIRKLVKLDQKPTPDEMAAISSAWEPYLSYASLYLWRSVEKTE